MPKQHWLGNAILALVGLGACLFLGILLAGVIISEYANVHEVNATYQQNSEEDRRNAAEEVAKSCERGTPDFRTCISNHLEAYYQDQTTNQDLQAQQDMAFWGAAIFLGIGQALLSAGGIYLLIESLSRTSDALEISRHANQIASDNAERQLRGYVFIDKIEVVSVPSDRDGKQGFLYKVWIKNYGQTPVQIIRLVQSYRVIRDGNIDGIKWVDRTGDQVEEDQVLMGPGANRVVTTFSMNVEQVNDLSESFRVLYRVLMEYRALLNSKATVTTSEVFEVRLLGDPAQAFKGVPADQLITFIGHSKGSGAT